ncbi:MAG: right-handed parallel beta-helix repeat-containing protein, partial [Candidatus Sulfotelmatobacter sp.]
TVDCSNNNGQSFPSITAALNTLNLVGPNVITVSGVCHENVTIAQRDRLTIQAAAGQLATIENAASPAGITLLIVGSHNITLTGLIVEGGSLALYVSNGSSTILMQNCTVQNSLGDGLDIDGQSALLIQNSTIKNNAAQGLFVSDASQLTLGTYPTQRIRISGNGFGGGGNGSGGLAIDGSQVQLNFGVLTVDGNAGPGVSMEGGRLQFYGGDEDSPGIIQNNNGGLMMTNAASATLWSAFSIRNNGSTGISLTASSSINFYPTVDSTGHNAVTSITGHSLTGVALSQSSGAQLYGAQISKNGSAASGSTGGIAVSGSSLTIGSGASVSNNVGPGIAMFAKSDLVMFDMTVSNNTEQGVFETNLSAAGFYQPLTFGQNAGGSVVCDDFSVAYGDVASISGVGCKNITSASKQRPSFNIPKMH